jgi:vacuolar-type H+-ATPase subunit I/STV1
METAMMNNQQAPKDMASLLAQVETLQRQLNGKASELKECQEREESMRGQVRQLEDVNGKLTEAKKESMKVEFNERIQGWINSLDPKQVPDGLKEEFLKGVENFANKGNESGVWKVMCCASAVHQNQVSTINKITEEYNALKSKVEGGEFRSEESRKRKEPEVCTDMWSQLEGLCTGYACDPL